MLQGMERTGMSISLILDTMPRSKCRNCKESGQITLQCEEAQYTSSGESFGGSMV